MNKKHLFILATLAVIAIVWAGVFSTQNARSETTISEADMDLASESPIYRYPWADETVTGTNNDTFTVPTLLYSLWSYNYTIDVTMEADTASFVAILQESNTNTGSDWYEVERDSVANLITSTQVRLYGSDNSRSAIDPALVRGRRQRVIFDVIAGTDDTLTVSPNVTMKKW
jgi:hypothetical protein